MKLRNIIGLSLLAVIISIPVIANAKDFKSANGANYSGNVYTSGTGSYISAFAMCETNDPNVKRVSASIITTYPYNSVVSSAIGTSKAQVYVIGGAGNSYSGVVTATDDKGISLNSGICY